ncbi:MAG: methylmalonyl Co-A mutase-associated GTPase MeaB [Flavobacteriales bacterium]
MSNKDVKHSAKAAALTKIRSKSQKELSTEEISARIIKGDKTVLSEAITLLESTNGKHRNLASEIIELCLPHSGNSFRLGITGVPGVGKSTFIESFGNLVLGAGKKLAVLAIDPSSQKTKGSILGDKTRMQTLISKDEVFIRPSPTSESLGGVARSTREAIILCEAAGYDFIIVETVGVGQSETEVSSMVDFFLLLMLSGAGDELQGIKRGIMEMADALVITKADGDNAKTAKRAMAEYRNAIHLLPPAPHLFPVKTLTCSALDNTGLNEIYELLEEFLTHTNDSRYFQAHRAQQNVHWFNAHLKTEVLGRFFKEAGIKEKLQALTSEVANGSISPFSAVEKLISSSLL